MFLSVLKVLMPLMSPIVPIEIRSSTFTPVFSNFFARYTTSRRLWAISFSRAASWFISPSSIFWFFSPLRAMRHFCSSSCSKGAGSTSVPPMYHTYSSSFHNPMNQVQTPFNCVIFIIFPSILFSLVYFFFISCYSYIVTYFYLSDNSFLNFFLFFFRCLYVFIMSSNNYYYTYFFIKVQYFFYKFLNFFYFYYIYVYPAS